MTCTCAKGSRCAECMGLLERPKPLIIRLVLTAKDKVTIHPQRLPYEE